MTFPVSRATTSLFFILIVSQSILARSKYGPFYPGLDIPQYILGETETMDNDMYSDVKKYHQSVPTYSVSWPWIGDTTNLVNAEPSAEEKTIVPEPIPTPLPLQKIVPLKNLSRSYDRKRNASSRRRLYMSPCHFKICNMGKRNAPTTRK